MSTAMRVAGVTMLLAFACAPVTRTLYEGETVVPIESPKPAVVDAGPPPVDAAPAPRVAVQADRIQINEKIQFDLNRSTIRTESDGLLDEIATAIKSHPTLKKIRVEGHSSGEGEAAANMKLSEERAKAVVAALEKRGVAKGVLVAKGFGSTVPLVPEKSDSDRERNRRVDFVIVDPNASDVGAKK